MVKRWVVCISLGVTLKSITGFLSNGLVCIFLSKVSDPYSQILSEKGVLHAPNGLQQPPPGPLRVYVKRKVGIHVYNQHCSYTVIKLQALTQLEHGSTKNC